MAPLRPSRPLQDPCYLQEELPAELRNEIYELVFTTISSDNSQDNASASVDLFHATPPSKSIVLTCRQMYEEAHDMYKTAYQSYWRNTSFTINGNTITRAAISTLREEDLQRITKLNTTRTAPQTNMHITEMLTPDGIWHDRLISDGWEHDEYYVMTAKPTVGGHYMIFSTESEAVEWDASTQRRLSMKAQLAEFISLKAHGQ